MEGDVVEWPLFKRLPKLESGGDIGDDAGNDLILDRFLDYLKEKKVQLYPAQEEAILELLAGKNVILNTPTGSGKSLVAMALHFQSLALGHRSIYTCPIKALVNEKFLALCRDFGPNQVGMITGDTAVNPEAPILCCTAEILAIDALRYGKKTPIQDVIIDEFHYYSDRDRGVAWQIPLLTLSQSRFLLMSATLGDTDFFQTELTKLNQRETLLIRSTERPVPLEFEYSENPLHETISKMLTLGRAPVYLVNFSQRECAEEAQNLLSVDICSKEEKKAIIDALGDFRFSSPYGKEIQKVLKHGVGIHHAGLLPKYRVLVEKLAQGGLLKVICGTDTLGVGVNVPIRTVLFTKLCKFDGEKTTLLSVRDFQQISGRAGRKGFDNQGYVVAQAPAHQIENLRLEQKAAGDPKKLRKIVKKKPPEKGFVPWNRETFTRLAQSAPEALVSRFQVSHAMLLHVLSRKDEDGCRAMQAIVRHSHESPSSKKHHRKKGFQLFRSLIDRKIIELNPLRLNVDLQEDFSLNHALSLYLIDALQVLDPQRADYAVDLLTLVESILENPDLILRRQLDRIKTEKMEEMKMEGIEYDQRIEELEKLEYPKPNRDFIYETFNTFAAHHPWIGSENIRPKSIAREMYESFFSFAEYIRDYGLQRAEGLLLRYVSDVFKTLAQTVPASAKNDEVIAIEEYLGSMVRQVDSSLLDEWERMRNPNWVSQELLSQEAGRDSSRESRNLIDNPQAFTIAVRNEIFRLVRALSLRDYEQAFAWVQPQIHSELTSTEQMEKIFKDYYEAGHSRICTDTRARSPKNTHIQIQSDQKIWTLQQVLIDPEEMNDWALHLTLDLESSRQNQKPILHLENVGPL